MTGWISKGHVTGRVWRSLSGVKFQSLHPERISHLALDLSGLDPAWTYLECDFDVDQWLTQQSSMHWRRLMIWDQTVVYSVSPGLYTLLTLTWS